MVCHRYFCDACKRANNGKCLGWVPLKGKCSSIDTLDRSEGDDDEAWPCTLQGETASYVPLAKILQNVQNQPILVVPKTEQYVPNPFQEIQDMETEVAALAKAYAGATPHHMHSETNRNNR